MKIYGVETTTLNRYFTNKEDLERFVKLNNLPVYPENIVKVFYLGSIYNREDVIKKVYANEVTEIYTPRDEKTISFYTEELIWITKPGTLINEFKILSELGVTFKNDIYSLNCQKKLKKKHL